MWSVERYQQCRELAPTIRETWWEALKVIWWRTYWNARFYHLKRSIERELKRHGID